MLLIWQACSTTIVLTEKNLLPAPKRLHDSWRLSLAQANYFIITQTAMLYTLVLLLLIHTILQVEVTYVGNELLGGGLCSQWCFYPETAADDSQEIDHRLIQLLVVAQAHCTHCKLARLGSLHMHVAWGPHLAARVAQTSLGGCTDLVLQGDVVSPDSRVCHMFSAPPWCFLKFCCLSFPLVLRPFEQQQVKIPKSVLHPDWPGWSSRRMFALWFMALILLW